MKEEFTVIIAGAGVGGLVMGILLQQLSIKYVILEKANSFGCLGSSIAISPQVLRLFDQLGMLPDLLAIGMPVSGLSYFRQDRSLIGRNDMTDMASRYGFRTMMFPRPELMNILLSRIPKNHIHTNRRILDVAQNSHYVAVRCANQYIYCGSILIGCDGAYSAVRQRLYSSEIAKGVDIPAHDRTALRFNQFALVGVANLDGTEGFMNIEEDCSDLLVTVSDKLPYSTWVMPLKNNRIGWGISGNLLTTQIHEQVSFKKSEWGREYIDEGIMEVRNLPCPLGGSFGILLDRSNRDVVSKVMLEDKCFSTWHGGRVVLLGDACHKLIPFAGQGAIQAILDAICLSNLIAELPSYELEDVERAFEAYTRIRQPTAAAAVDTSIWMMKVVSGQTFLNNWSRKFLFNMPPFFYNRVLDKMYAGRPMAHFLPPVNLRGSVPDSTPAMTAYPNGPPIRLELQALEESSASDTRATNGRGNTSKSGSAFSASNNACSRHGAGTAKLVPMFFVDAPPITNGYSGGVGGSIRSTKGKHDTKFTDNHKQQQQQQHPPEETLKIIDVATLASDDAHDGDNGDESLDPSPNQFVATQYLH